MKKGDRGTTYLVIENGVQFRTIAKVMSGVGYKMNHATARTKCTYAVRKLLNAFLHEAQKANTGEFPVTIDQLMLNKEVHNTLPELLYAAFGQELKQMKENK